MKIIKMIIKSTQKTAQQRIGVNASRRNAEGLMAAALCACAFSITNKINSVRTHTHTHKLKWQGIRPRSDGPIVEMIV